MAAWGGGAVLLAQGGMAACGGGAVLLAHGGMAACGSGGAVLLATDCAMMAAGVAGGSGGKAKKAADSWRASELGAALGDTYTLQNTNCCCWSLSPHDDEYSSMSQSVRTPHFL